MPDGALPPASSSSWRAPKRRPQVEQLILLATHVLEALEPRLLRHYNAQLQATVNAGLSKPVVELWVLFYKEADRSPSAYFDGAASALTQTQIAVWGDQARDRALPRLPGALAASWGFQQQTDAHLRTYFYQHTGLYLWLRQFGSAYPSLRYLWRMEPDVMLTGSLGSLISFSARDRTSDLLLPKATSRLHAPRYGCSKQRYRPDEAYGQRLPQPSERVQPPGESSGGPGAAIHTTNTALHTHEAWVPPCTTHWTLNTPLLRLVRPQDEPVFALVPIARLSVRFVTETLGQLWLNGTFGYEEMLLPMACRFYADRCSLGHFTSGSTVSAAAVKFRPVKPCELFLQALRQDTALPADQTTSQGHRASTKRAQHAMPRPRLFHPVKNRSCVLDFWDDRPLPPPAALGAQDKLEKIGFER